MNSQLVSDMCFIEERECSKACLQTNSCTAYVSPAAWKRKGGCPLSSIQVIEVKAARKVNPLKAAKRATQGKI